MVACGTAAKPSAVDPRTGTTAIPTGNHGQGVAITEGGSYGDRHDPSGWSGTTTPPKGVGGGPVAQVPAEPAAPKAPAPQSSGSTTVEPTKTVDATKVTPKAAPKAPAAKGPESKKPSPAPASSVPPSKDLDVSPPPKDLQF